MPQILNLAHNLMTTPNRLQRLPSLLLTAMLILCAVGVSAMSLAKAQTGATSGMSNGEFWYKFAQNFGILGLILAAIGIFIWKALWPFFKDHVNTLALAVTQQADASKEVLKEQAQITQRLLQEQLAYHQQAGAERATQFFNALERRDNEFKEVVSELRNVSEAQRNQTQALQSLSQHIAETHKEHKSK